MTASDRQSKTRPLIGSDEIACRYVAERLRCSGFALHELQKILRDEVAPAFLPNLFVAGEWNAWSPEAVRNIVLSHLEKRSNCPRLPVILRRRWRQWTMEPIAGDWEKIKAMLISVAAT
ncbi:hypothetical protein BJG93_17120 [Paraburkholderia sprentiae WSM5005]|uniref:DUF7079 domain-containing protein n=1 Tax=Paraburkholderia sprentiae WSM5005 TaxID=754502 RepID=A0A1I9YLS6_9BURK|nr:hypothetical protein [Paraburkholderia sprentiae]APA87259.2 hypothetical protein BJG93_17120 [Paraburkholderia sprentiae WSM5005]